MAETSLRVALAITITILIVSILVIIALIIWGVNRVPIPLTPPDTKPNLPIPLNPVPKPPAPTPSPNPNPPIPPTVDCKDDLQEKIDANLKILAVNPSTIKDIAELGCNFIVLTNNNHINLYNMDGELINTNENIDNLEQLVNFNDNIFALDDKGSVYKLKSKISSVDWYWEELDIAPGEQIKWINASLVYSNISDFSSTSASGEKYTKSYQYLWITTDRNSYLINSKMNIIDLIEKPEMRVYGAGKGNYLVINKDNTITLYPKDKTYNNANYGLLNNDNKVITYDNKCGLIKGMRLIDNKPYYLLNLLKTEVESCGCK